MRKRVYVAGPISQGDLATNTKNAVEAGVSLMEAGYAAWIPHGSCYYNGPFHNPFPSPVVGKLTSTDWYEADVAWVSVAEAVLRLPGPSVGADLEVKCAEENGIPVFDSIDGLRCYFEEGPLAYSERYGVQSDRGLEGQPSGPG